MSLKFKVTGTRNVDGVEPGGTLEIAENRALPGYVGEKKNQKPGINVPALLLSDLVEPANAETRKWCASLTGSGFADKYGTQAETEEARSNG